MYATHESHVVLHSMILFMHMSQPCSLFNDRGYALIDFGQLLLNDLLCRLATRTSVEPWNFQGLAAAIMAQVQ